MSSSEHAHHPFCSAAVREATVRAPPPPADCSTCAWHWRSSCASSGAPLASTNTGASSSERQQHRVGSTDRRHQQRLRIAAPKTLQAGDQYHRHTGTRSLLDLWLASSPLDYRAVHTQLTPLSSNAFARVLCNVRVCCIEIQIPDTSKPRKSDLEDHPPVIQTDLSQARTEITWRARRAKPYACAGTCTR